MELLLWRSSICPHAALLYAVGAQGVVLVIDVPADGTTVSAESWQSATARHFMVWGRFDKFFATSVPAKELRARIRKNGVAATLDQYNAEILKRAINERLAIHQHKVERTLVTRLSVGL